MKPTHSLVWETTGIHDAIIDSGLKIPKNERLLLWFDEKWSPKTNTFVTLEDIMVLGGFSVLGAPVTCQVESPEDHAALDELVHVFRSRSKKASLSAWMNIFKGTQNALEHEAFLAFWLSKYLFAYVKDTVLPETFRMAILLAKGRRIALTPAILATLYQDLHFLQDAIIDVMQGVGSYVVKGVFSTMYYAQAWIWERFSNVSPTGETRLARW
ncbi:uncharacterized protein LOC143544946 [Bidens hawaiensis]|uniref:uncharacterized protein LOC143544946 n=1 Tax=Bidens hawaiensis TaxID=980011 RepID=UPI004049D931